MCNIKFINSRLRDTELFGELRLTKFQNVCPIICIGEKITKTLKSFGG
jgi:uroporphyrinogen-III synthase